MALPAPASFWITTSWPCVVKAATPDGVMATRFSSSLISVGTPTNMCQIVSHLARMLGERGRQTMRFRERRHGV